MTPQDVRSIRDLLLNKILELRAEAHRLKCNRKCQSIIMELEQIINNNISEKEVK